jgi:hypothetical protein
MFEHRLLAPKCVLDGLAVILDDLGTFQYQGNLEQASAIDGPKYGFDILTLASAVARELQLKVKLQG